MGGAASVSAEREDQSAELERQRADLQRMQSEVWEAAEQLKEQQEASKKLAEDRELRMLEEEGEQLRIADALRAEGDRLHQQRKSVALLQAGALRMLDSASARPEGGCLEVAFDAGDGENGAKDESASDTDEEEVWN